MRATTSRLANVSKRLLHHETDSTNQPLVIAIHEKAIELLMYLNLVAGNPPFARLRVDAETEKESMKLDRRQMSPLGFMLDFVRQHAYPLVDGNADGLPNHLKEQLVGRHPLHVVLDDWARRGVITDKAATVLATWIPAAKDVQSNAELLQTQDANTLLN